MSVTVTQTYTGTSYPKADEYTPYTIPAERRPYGAPTSAPSTFRDMSPGYSLTAQPAQGTHAGRTVTVEPDRDPVVYSAQVEDYKRKIEMFLCKKLGKSKEKAAAIVSFLPTKDIKIELPAVTITREVHGKELDFQYNKNVAGFEDRGEKYLGMQIPARTITRRIEDVYKHIYDALMTVNQFEHSLETMNELLHFDGCHAEKTKTERLQMRSLILLSLAWLDISDSNIAERKNRRLPCILFFDSAMLSITSVVKSNFTCARGEKADGILRKKYATDLFAQAEYQGAKKVYSAHLDGSIRGSGSTYAVFSAQKIHEASQSRDNVPDLDSVYPVYAMEQYIFNKLKEII